MKRSSWTANVKLAALSGSRYPGKSKSNFQLDMALSVAPITARLNCCGHDWASRWVPLREAMAASVTTSSASLGNISGALILKFSRSTPQAAAEMSPSASPMMGLQHTAACWQGASSRRWFSPGKQASGNRSGKPDVKSEIRNDRNRVPCGWLREQAFRVWDFELRISEWL